MRANFLSHCDSVNVCNQLELGHVHVEVSTVCRYVTGLTTIVMVTEIDIKYNSYTELRSENDKGIITELHSVALNYKWFNVCIRGQYHCAFIYIIAQNHILYQLLTL